MTMTILISALFLGSAAFAFGAIAATLRADWPSVIALRSAMQLGAEDQDVRVTTVAINVRGDGTVLRPDFTGRGRHPARALRAAA